MTKILYVHHGKGIGGAPLSLLYTIRGVRDEFTPEVLFIHHGEIVKKFQREGIKCDVDSSILDLSHTEVSNYSILNPMFWFRLFYQPISFAKFYLMCQKSNADVVHLNTSSLVTLAIAAKLAGKKVVMHIREPLAGGLLGLRQIMLRNLIDWFTDAIIPISQYDASKLKSSTKIKVVHNFVDFEVFDKDKKCTSYKHLQKGPVILHLGGISSLKGTHVLIKSLKFVKKQIKHFTCIVAGEDKDRTGFLKREMKKEIDANNLSENVIFMPSVLDPHELIACADVIVFPSTKPHFARPIIEASAMGKPVVASDLGGPRELVVNGKTGFLVKSNDAAALGNAIANILSDKHLAMVMGKNGNELAWKKFELGKNIAEIKKTYRQLVKR